MTVAFEPWSASGETRQYKQMKPFFFVMLLWSLTQPLFAQTIDTDASKVTFEVSNMRMRTVEGSFSGMEGSITFDEQDLANASFEVCIAAETVNTDNKKRDEHLRKEDFFHVEEYPTICFASSKISSTANGFLAEGTLSMRGVSKPLSIPFTYTNNTFTGSLSVNRTDYKVGGNGGFMVGKTVEMEIVCVVEEL